MEVVYLSLGSNLGNREANLKAAVDLIEQRINPVLELSSNFYSEPWGYTSNNAYVNCALSVQTSLAPETLLLVLQDIEKELGRTSKTTTHYSDRLIDIDIIYYGQHLYHSVNLHIPHPHRLVREFVFRPLLEITPNILDPEFQTLLKLLVTRARL